GVERKTGAEACFGVGEALLFFGDLAQSEVGVGIGGIEREGSGVGGFGFGEVTCAVVLESMAGVRSAIARIEIEGAAAEFPALFDSGRARAEIGEMEAGRGGDGRDCGSLAAIAFRGGDVTLLRGFEGRPKELEA